MNSKKEVQHVYLVGAKSLGAYGGYETFVYKLTEYHQNLCQHFTFCPEFFRLHDADRGPENHAPGTSHWRVL